MASQQVRAVVATDPHGQVLTGLTMDALTLPGDQAMLDTPTGRGMGEGYRSGADIDPATFDLVPFTSAGHLAVTAQWVPAPAARVVADAGLPDDAAAWPIAFVAAWPDYDAPNVYATARQLGTTSHQQLLDDFTDVAGYAVIDPNQRSGVPHYPRPSADLLSFDAELDLAQNDLPGAP